jgi:hypothetical protein
MPAVADLAIILAGRAGAAGLPHQHPVTSSWRRRSSGPSPLRRPVGPSRHPDRLRGEPATQPRQSRLVTVHQEFIPERKKIDDTPSGASWPCTTTCAGRRHEALRRGQPGRRFPRIDPLAATRTLARGNRARHDTPRPPACCAAIVACSASITLPPRTRRPSRSSSVCTSSPV